MSRGRGLQTGSGPGSFQSLSRSSRGSARWPTRHPPASPHRSGSRFGTSLSSLSLVITHRTRSVRPASPSSGLSQPLFAKFLGVEVSALCHWEQGIRSPSAVVRRFLDEMNATPDHWWGRIEAAVRRTRRDPSARGRKGIQGRPQFPLAPGPGGNAGRAAAQLAKPDVAGKNDPAR